MASVRAIGLLLAAVLCSLLETSSAGGGVAAVGGMTDPYFELGLVEADKPDAKVVKRAYRKLSVKYHPDKAGGKHRDQFDRVREAYEILSDDKRRTCYEMGGMKFLKEVDNGKVQQSREVQMNMEIPLPYIYKGEEIPITPPMSFKRVCKNCGKNPHQPHCRGCGRCPNELQIRLVQMMPGFNVQQQVEVPSKERCRTEKPTWMRQIEPGTPVGHKITFAAAGEQRPGMIPPDIIVVVKEAKHPTFERKDDDLHTAIKITLKESLLGFTKQITQLDGHAIIVTREGTTRPGQIISVVGEGMPKYNFPAEAGNLYVKVSIVYPTSISQHDIDLLKQTKFA